MHLYVLNPQRGWRHGKAWVYKRTYYCGTDDGMADNLVSSSAHAWYSSLCVIIIIVVLRASNAKAMECSCGIKTNKLLFSVRPPTILQSKCSVIWIILASVPWSLLISARSCSQTYVPVLACDEYCNVIVFTLIRHLSSSACYPSSSVSIILNTIAWQWLYKKWKINMID